jgi:hypothetical protein
LLTNIDRSVAAPAFIGVTKGVAPGERSGAQALARNILFDRRNGKPQVSRLQMIGASAREGTHIRLRYPAPDHLAPMEVSALAHCLARRIVIQQFNCRCRESFRVFKGDQRSASVVQ